VPHSVAARFLFGPMLMSIKDVDTHHPFSHRESPHLPNSEAENDDATTVQRDDPERQPLLDRTPSSSNAEIPSSERRAKSSKPLLSRAWSTLKSFTNPPLIGGAIAIVVGAIPFLHDFILSKDAPLAAFTESIRTIGKLYTALQMFVLGGQLYAKRQVSILTLPNSIFIFSQRREIGSGGSAGHPLMEVPRHAGRVRVKHLFSS
jgi:predicted permease